jgi:hypothetical protein
VASPDGTRGTDWVDLAVDQCTVYYTNEGPTIRRYNMCTGTQLADFATVSGASCAALRIRPATNEVMLACSDGAHRLSPTGANLQTYALGSVFALNLDPNGTSFWTAAPGGRTLYKVNITTGVVEAPSPITTRGDTWGLAIFGELTAGGGGGGGTKCDENDGNGDIKDDNSANHASDNRDVKVNSDQDDDNPACDNEPEEPNDKRDNDQKEVNSHDNRSGDDFHSSKVQSVQVVNLLNGKKATIMGLGTHNGRAVSFLVVEIDNGPSLPGFFRLELSDGYKVAGSLVDGTIALR